MADAVTVSADDVRTVSAVYDIISRAFGSSLQHVPGFGAALEACSRMSGALTEDEMPPDPVAPATEVATGHYVLMTTYESVGFEHGEAFMIALAHIQASAQGRALRGHG